jgi:hypothetical protein
MTISTKISRRTKIKAYTPTPLLPRLVKLGTLVLVDAFVIWFITRLVPLGYYPLAAAVGAIAVFVNY